MRLRPCRSPLLALALLGVAWNHLCVWCLCVVDLNPDHGNPRAGLRDHRARMCLVARFAAGLGCSFTYQSPARVLDQRHNAEVEILTLDWGQYIQLPENLLQHNCSRAGSVECWEWRPSNTTSTAVAAATGSRPGGTSVMRLADGGALAPISKSHRVTTMAAVAVGDWLWLSQARATQAHQERSLTIGRLDSGFYGPPADGSHRAPPGTQPLRKYILDDSNFALANGTSLMLDPRPNVSGCDPGGGHEYGSLRHGRVVAEHVSLPHGLVVAQMAAKATKAVFGDDPFVVLLLRRGDRVRQYPNCSKAVNVARVFTRLSTAHYTANRRLYGSLTNERACFHPVGRQLGVTVPTDGTHLLEEHAATRRKCDNVTAVPNPPRSVLVGTNEADANYIEVLVRELRGTFDRVVLEPEFKQHISPVDNYQFFSVLLQTTNSARWHLNFAPHFIQAACGNRSLMSQKLGFDPGPAEQLCPEGI